MVDYIVIGRYGEPGKKSDSRINDKNIKQVFIPNDLFEFGKIQIEVENIKINIYDEERMLV